MQWQSQPTIGFIGQGFIGKNYADDFAARGHRVVRYALEEPYCGNKDAISACEITFIAVPAPTTPDGFDDSIIREVLACIGSGNIAVIKSTTLPHTTEHLQAQYPDIIVLHSPEFLRERTAPEDAAHPSRNIIGMPKDTQQYRHAAERVMAVLPEAPYTNICLARESEFLKYAANGFLYAKVVYANMLYDMAKQLDCSWEAVRDGVTSDPRIGPAHFDPVHASGHTQKSGRGAGGHCFIKDFAAMRQQFEELLPDDIAGGAMLRSIECKNIDLLTTSEKDLDLLEDVYGSDPTQVCNDS